MQEKDDNLITKEGYKELQEEIKNLIDIERPKVIQEIKEARLLGDLSENAEFDAARDSQGRIEDRITEIERILATAKVISENKNINAIVSIGSTVSLEINKKIYNYKIVGSLEADPFSGKISNVSPLGLELMGKKDGDQISFLVNNNKNSKKIIGKINTIKS